MMILHGRRARSARSSGWIAGLLILLASPGLANAGENASGWTPAFRIGPAIHLQGLDGTVFGPDTLPFIQQPSPFPDNPTTLATEDFDVSTQGAPGDSIQTIEFRFGLRLYAPEIPLPIDENARPRPFIQIGAERPLDEGFIAMRYNSTFNLGVPQQYGTGRTLSEFCPGTPTTQACAYSSRVYVDVLANWSFGLGADFPLPIAENQYHLTPFVEYFGQAFESNAEFVLNLSQGLVASDSKRPIKSNSDTEILHGIAAGLGFEVDVYETEWFGLRLFLESRAAWILNGRTVRFDAVNPTPTPNFSSADFMVRPSGFVTTAAGGIEIRLNGL